MNPTAEHLLTAALALPEDDRADLIDALITSLQREGQPPFDDAWHAIIQRRSAELQTGHVEGVPWSEVKQQAREASGG